MRMNKCIWDQSMRILQVACILEYNISENRSIWKYLLSVLYCNFADNLWEKAKKRIDLQILEWLSSFFLQLEQVINALNWNESISDTKFVVSPHNNLLSVGFLPIPISYFIVIRECIYHQCSSCEISTAQIEWHQILKGLEFLYTSKMQV